MQKLLTMIGAAAVVAAGAILPMAVLADVDENGLTPYHWYKLDGNTTSSGEAESSIIWRIGSYVESRSGQAAHSSNSHYTSRTALALGDGAWSVVCTARLPGVPVTSSTMTVAEFPVFAAGSGALNGIALVRSGYNEVKLLAFSGGTGTSNTATTKSYSSAVSVPALAGRFHNFVLVVEEEDSATNAKLYVDGEYKVTLACPFDRVPTSAMFQMGTIYSGGSLVDSCAEVEYDDFRLYQLALSSAQIAAIASAFAPWPEDENGDWPDYWFKFDGDTRQIGLDTLKMKRTNGALALADSFSGQALTFDSAMWSDGSSLNPSTNGNFTVSVTAKAVSGSGNVIWFAGTPLPLFIATSESGVALCQIENSAAVVLADAEVSTCAASFHNYVIAFDYLNGTIHFYVDGVEAGNGAAYSGSAPTGSYKTQFAQFNGQSYPTGYQAAKGTYVDDFRLYRRLLSDAEIANVAATFPPWPGVDALGETPLYWLPFNGDANQFGSSTGIFGSMYTRFTSDGADSVASASGMRSAYGWNPYTTSGNALAFGGTDWTVAAVAKLVPGEDGKAIVMSIGNPAAGSGSYYLLWESGVMSLYNLRDGAEAPTSLIAAPCSSGATMFHHYAVVCAGGETMSLFIDGAKVGEASVECTETSFIVQLSKGYGMGTGSVGYTAYNSSNIFDDWRAYGRALGGQEVHSISKDEFGISRRGLTITFY